MNWDTFLENYGERNVLALGIFLIALLFGVAAQQSKFCLRAAVIDVTERVFGSRMVVWLLTFGCALTLVQVLVLMHTLDPQNSRHLSGTGTLSGALVGGLVFGMGMILTRGCAGRLVVLAASGNLRALLTGLIFAVFAQASLSGVLAPLREGISSWWTVPGGERHLTAWIPLGTYGGLIFGLMWLAGGVYLVKKNAIHRKLILTGSCVGIAVALLWWWTYQVSIHVFTITPINSFTFSGPSAEVLTWLITRPVPASWQNSSLLMMLGIVLGSFAAAKYSGEFALAGFQDGLSMRRYIIGGALMGFGAMLAGGCSIGAGVTGGSVLAVTGWLALLGIWLGGMLTHWWVDMRKSVPFFLP